MCQGMNARYDYYAIVIGAGAAGLVVAKGLAKAGKKVLLVEKGPYGGDCANFGCIPTKALIASANVAHEVWRSGLYGIDMQISGFQSNRVLDRVRAVVEQIRAKNSPPALNPLGVETLTASAAFVDPHTIAVGERKITAKKIIIATGSIAHVPNINGLPDLPFHTSQTLFSLKEVPSSLAIIGGGQIGCELALAFKRLGSSVTLVEQADILLKQEEPEAYKAVQSALIKEGVEIYLRHEVTRVWPDGDKAGLTLRHKLDDKTYDVRVKEVMIACGRRPNLKELNLEAAGVRYTEKGIEHDGYGRTTKPHIWVVGDASGESFFTHAAVQHARRVLLNLLLPWPFKRKLDTAQAVPRIISSDPEVASIGLTEKEANELYGNSSIATYIVALPSADRAICEAREDGFVKIVTKRYSGKILGATVVSPIGADMLPELQIAMREGVTFRKLASLIHPYPTYSQIIQKAADKWLKETILPLIGKFIS